MDIKRLPKAWLAAGFFIALLFIVALFWLPGWLDARNQIRVAVVSDTPDALTGLLQSDDFRISGVQYIATLKPDFLVPGALQGFDQVVVYRAPVCDRTARQVFADFVQAGGKLVLVGDACTRVIDSTQTGWSIGSNNFGQVMPAVFQGALPVDSELKIYAIAHPMLNGILNYHISQTIAKVQPSTNATVLAFINSSDVESGNAIYGILEKSYGRGRVVYFAYDPFDTMTGGSRNLVLNLIYYLAGRPINSYSG